MSEGAPDATLSGEEFQQQAAQAARNRLEEFDGLQPTDVLEKRAEDVRKDREQRERMDEMDKNAELRGAIAEKKAEIQRGNSNWMREEMAQLPGGGEGHEENIAELQKQKNSLVSRAGTKQGAYAIKNGYRYVEEDLSGNVTARRDQFDSSEVYRSAKTIADQRQAERKAQEPPQAA